MLNPKVSVVIPTCNRAELLRRAINSVLNQEYQNLEIIVVDDSSGNDSENVIREFPQQYIRYFKRKQRGGVSSARNLGVKLSTGEYVAFLDDDDEWLPDKLKRQIGMLRVGDESVGVIHSNCFVDYGSSIVLVHNKNISNQLPQNLLEHYFVNISTSVIKKDCFNIVGFFDEKMTYAEDWDFFVRVSRRFRFSYLYEPTAICHQQRVRADRLSENLRGVVKGKQIFFAKHWKEYERYRITRVRAHELLHIGLQLRVLKERKAANWYFLKASSVYPVNFLPLLYLCFYTFEDSDVNKKLDFANVVRRFAKQKSFWQTLSRG